MFFEEEGKPIVDAVHVERRRNDDRTYDGNYNL